MGVESYEQARLLEEPELRRLLSAGSSLERVWAAWALGLRRGAKFAPEAGAQLAAEPDPGVRRHLAVILAGAGDRDAVQALADHDPADVVRASALRLRLQMSTGSERAQVVDALVGVATGDPSVELRYEVLRILSTIPNEFSALRLEPCLADANVELRALTLELLCAVPSEEVTACLIRHSARECAPHLRRPMWLRLGAAGVVRAVIDRLVSEPSTLLEALQVWSEVDRRLPWPEVERATELGDAQIDLALFGLVHDEKSVPLGFLIPWASAGLRITQPRNEAERASAYLGFWARSALSAIGHEGYKLALDSDQQQAIARIISDLERAEEDAREEYLDDPDDEDAREELEWTRGTKHGLMRLLGLDVRSRA